jgi:hypothetical protein
MRSLVKGKSAPVSPWQALKDENKQHQFEAELKNRFSALEVDSLELQEHYDLFTEAVSSAALASLGSSKKSKEKRHWVAQKNEVRSFC